MDDDMNVPDIRTFSSGEILVGLLLILAVLAGTNSLGFSIPDPSSAFATFAIVCALAAVAVAILSVGRTISESN